MRKLDGEALYSGEQSFNIVGKRKLWYWVSGIAVIISLAATLIMGLNLSVEFTGGTELIVKGTHAAPHVVQEALDPLVAGTPTVQAVGSDSLKITTGPLTTAEVTKITQAAADSSHVQVSAVALQVVGPSWGAQITHQALLALGAFLLVVLGYLSLRFEWRMAVAAIVAVGHDVAITIGVYALTRIEVSPATVIGFLTILGYSLYDTVVVFDKVRENTLPISIRAANTSISKAANLAVNQTLVRSLSTTLIALLPVLAILFVGVGLMGAGVLKDLAVALFVGLTVGAYSSIFVATPLFVTFSKNAEKIQGVRRTTSPNRRKAAAISDEPTTDNNLFEEVTPLVDDLPVEAVKPQTAPKRNSGSRATRTQGKKNSKGGGRSRK